MTFKECVISSLGGFGTISDVGISRFAVEWGFDPASTVDSDQQSTISRRISAWIDDLVMHPISVSENGHSASWDGSLLKKGVMMKLRQYGITPSGDTMNLIGVSTISDATDRW